MATRLTGHLEMTPGSSSPSRISSQAVSKRSSSLSIQEIQDWLKQDIRVIGTKEYADFQERLFELPELSEEKIADETGKFCRQLVQFIDGDDVISETRIPSGDTINERLSRKRFLLTMPQEWLDDDKRKELEDELKNFNDKDEAGYSERDSSPLTVRDFFEFCFLLRNQSVGEDSFGRVRFTPAETSETSEMFSCLKKRAGNESSIRRLIPWKFISPSILYDEINFSGFTQVDFSEADLRGEVQSFTGNLCNGVDFSRADLRKAEFSQATFGQKTSFSETDLREVKFNRSTFDKGTSVVRADLREAEFRHVTFRKGVSFVEVDLKGAKFDNCTFSRKAQIPFAEADLSEVTFTNTKFGIGSNVGHGLFSAPAEGSDNDTLARDYKQKIQNLKTLMKVLHPVKLPQADGQSKTESILNIYERLTQYIDAREAREGLTFFQAGNTCSPQKLEFILRVGHILVEVLNSDHLDSPQQLQTLTARLDGLADWVKNNHSDILAPRRWGNNNRSLNNYFKEFCREIERMQEKFPQSDADADRAGPAVASIS